MIHVWHLLSLAITSSLPTCFAFFSVCKPSPTRQPHGWILADCCRSCHGLTLNFLNFSEPVASLLCQEAATIPNSLQLASLISACTKQACLRTRDLSRTVFFRDLQNGSLIYTTFIAPVHAVQVSGTVDAARGTFYKFHKLCHQPSEKKKKRGYDKSKWRLWSPAAPKALGAAGDSKKARRQERQRLDGGHRIMETAQRCPTAIMEATCWRIKSHTTKPNLPQLLTSSHCLRIWKEHLDTCGLDATTNDHLWSCSWFDAAFSFISLFCSCIF